MLISNSFIWSVVLFMHVVSNTWGSLMAVRFFLGLVEGMYVVGLSYSSLTNADSLLVHSLRSC